MPRFVRNFLVYIYWDMLRYFHNAPQTFLYIFFATFFHFVCTILAQNANSFRARISMCCGWREKNSVYDLDMVGFHFNSLHTSLWNISMLQHIVRSDNLLVRIHTESYNLIHHCELGALFCFQWHFVCIIEIKEKFVLLFSMSCFDWVAFFVLIHFFSFFHHLATTFYP